MEKKELEIIQEEEIITKIFFIREQRVMLDKDLASMYKVETKVLNQAVKRNVDRFPPDFMFQINETEFKNLMSQNVTSSWGGTRKLPYVFSEHGILMLSSVLNSKRAIQVNIQIMRVFTQIRKLVLNQMEIYKKLAEIDKKFLEQNIRNKANDQQFKVIFEAIKQILIQEEKPLQIGFLKEEK